MTTAGCLYDLDAVPNVGARSGHILPHVIVATSSMMHLATGSHINCMSMLYNHNLEISGYPARLGGCEAFLICEFFEKGLLKACIPGHQSLYLLDTLLLLALIALAQSWLCLNLLVIRNR